MNAADVNIKNRVFLVTGGTAGVGKAIALGLAKIGAKVIIVSRTDESGLKTVKYITEASGNGKIEYLAADLALQSSIRKACEEFKRKHDRLHVLINAAGAIFFEKRLTSEGTDTSFAVNYLSHFLLTNQLIDILKDSHPSRVITVAGAPGYLKNPKIDLDDIQLKNHYSGMQAVSRAMFARFIFTFKLAKRLDGTGVTSIAFHPGLIKSNLTNNAPWILKAMSALIFSPWSKSECGIGIYLATSKEVEKTNGVFYDDKYRIVPFRKNYDEAVANKLWNISEKLTSIVRTE
jgi:NAD(P)-dependent dehydrogenase (short-subunit alcohol dehydrogenase family)